jgi:hypothetical protein
VSAVRKIVWSAWRVLAIIWNEIKDAFEALLPAMMAIFVVVGLVATAATVAHIGWGVGR